MFLETSDSPRVPELFLFLPTLQIANEVIGEMNLKPEEVFLAQGTLRPDLIESASLVASGKAEVIKTHHNDTELIRRFAFRFFALACSLVCACNSSQLSAPPGLISGLKNWVSAGLVIGSEASPRVSDPWISLEAVPPPPLLRGDMPAS